jgi:DNA helicase HerA-like ATPase
MNNKKDFGVLYGQKTVGDALLIYSSYEDSKASPKLGDFIVLAPRDEEGQKFLARVEAEIYDEDPIFRNQDKTLIAVQYARISQRELSERDKQKMFSYTYEVNILGSYTQNDGKDFTTAVRKLPTVSYHARHLNQGEIANILNRTNQNGIDIGYLCIGEDYDTDNKIKFDVSKLKEKRTMVFAQSGFGKTNLMKVLIYNTIADTKYGKLIFDLNGEYYQKSTRNYGLGDIEDTYVKNNLVVYSDKKLSATDKFIYKGNVRINMHKHLSIGDVLNYSTGFSEVMKSFLLYLEDEQAEDFFQNINSYANDPQQLHIKYPDFWKDKDKSAGKTIGAIKKRLSFLIDESKGLHSSRSRLVEEVFEALKQGKTVIIDLSLRDSFEASVISNIFVRKLFENNKREYTNLESNQKGVINAVVFIEEAQNVLSEDFVRTNANPFVRLAKEGRKFGLGLVAVTQRPSAISEEIRTQAENFFVFYMGNTRDVKALSESNINYSGVISRFIQSETIAGNLYMVSANQSFALPLRVLEFEKLVHQKVYEDLRFKDLENRT